MHNAARHLSRHRSLASRPRAAACLFSDWTYSS